MNGFDIEEIETIINLGKDEMVNPDISGIIYSFGRDVENDEEYEYALINF